MKSRKPARALDTIGAGTRFALFINARLKTPGLKNANNGSGGYTFLEVMIVLAVTGALFASVVTMFSGKQSATQFSQAVRDYESKVQAVASDVATGFYDTGTVECHEAGSSVNFSSAPTPLGVNKGCIFLGKIITTGSDMATGSDYSEIFTLAGRQYKQFTTNDDIENLNDAGPKAVTTPVDLTENYVHKYGLMIKRVSTIVGDVQIGGLGFIHELTGGTGAGNPDTGSRGVLLYGLYGTTSPNNNNRAANRNLINNTSNLKLVPGGIRICLWDGKRRAEITVGDKGSQTATEVTIENGISDVCRTA